MAVPANRGELGNPPIVYLMNKHLPAQAAEGKVELELYNTSAL